MHKIFYDSRTSSKRKKVEIDQIKMLIKNNNESEIVVTIPYKCNKAQLFVHPSFKRKVLTHYILMGFRAC